MTGREGELPVRRGRGRSRRTAGCIQPPPRRPGWPRAATIAADGLLGAPVGRAGRRGGTPKAPPTRGGRWGVVSAGLPRPSRSGWPDTLTFDRYGTLHKLDLDRRRAAVGDRPRRPQRLLRRGRIRPGRGSSDAPRRDGRRPATAKLRWPSRRSNPSTATSPPPSWGSPWPPSAWA